MKIAVDLDGCLCKIHIPYRKAEPIKENIDKINSIGMTNKIIIFTARHEKDRALTVEWLRNNGVSYDRLVMSKIKYDVLIDDKAMNIEDL